MGCLAVLLVFMTIHKRILNTTVIVGALGYFVDIYDLVLFSIVRVSSLKAVGIPDDQLLDKGVFLINLQMTGMLLGGILWGILGDKKGRLSVLFGSIFLYSVANIANAFVTSIEAYGVWRFLAGIGLAGELGAAITLVSETMSKETRGYGTAIVAAVGICGAVVAALIGDYFDWKVAFIVGGVMGLALLVLRIGIFESGMFESSKSKNVKRGDLFMILGNRSRLARYLHCILIGVPIWYVIGILITFSPELSKVLGVEGSITGGRAIMFCYIGLAIGDLASGFLSQLFGTRKKVVLGFLTITLTFILLYCFTFGLSENWFYALCVGLGIGTGYWAVFVTISAEQFGTNLRATVATTSPNFVRGSVVPLTLAFQTLKGSTGLIGSALIVGLSCMALAFFSLYHLHETHGKELDFLEE